MAETTHTTSLTGEMLTRQAHEMRRAYRAETATLSHGALANLLEGPCDTENGDLYTLAMHGFVSTPNPLEEPIKLEREYAAMRQRFTPEYITPLAVVDCGFRSGRKVLVGVGLITPDSKLVYSLVNQSVGRISITLDQYHEWTNLPLQNEPIVSQEPRAIPIAQVLSTVGSSGPVFGDTRPGLTLRDHIQVGYPEIMSGNIGSVGSEFMRRMHIAQTAFLGQS